MTENTNETAPDPTLNDERARRLVTRGEYLAAGPTRTPSTPR